MHNFRMEGLGNALQGRIRRENFRCGRANLYRYGRDFACMGAGLWYVKCIIPLAMGA
jgi:hypothetical protein